MHPALLLVPLLLAAPSGGAVFPHQDSSLTAWQDGASRPAGTTVTLNQTSSDDVTSMDRGVEAPASVQQASLQQPATLELVLAELSLCLKANVLSPTTAALDAVGTRLDSIHESMLTIQQAVSSVQESQVAIQNTVTKLEEAQATTTLQITSVQKAQAVAAASRQRFQEKLASVEKKLSAMEESQTVADTREQERYDGLQANLSAAQAASVGQHDQLQGNLSSVLAASASLEDRLTAVQDTQAALSSQVREIKAEVGQLPGQALGGPCQEDADCRPVPNSECRSSACVCTDGFSRPDGGSSCRPFRRLTEACSADSDCQVATANSVCGTAGVCVCTEDGFRQAGNDTCQPFRHLTEACSADADCQVATSNTVCREQVCACGDGFSSTSNDTCQSFGRLTEACSADTECQVATSNTVCREQVCACAVGRWNRNNQECRPTAGAGQPCSYDGDCSFGGGQCVSNTCSCGVAKYGRYEYRLAGGVSCDRGRIELKRDGGNWGRVCDDYWGGNGSGNSGTDHGIANARVVCRSLGLSGGTAHIGSTPYGSGGAENFHMDNVKCSGSEAHLLECPYDGWGQDNCGTTEVTGVTCQP